MSLPPSEIPQGAIRFNTDSQKLEFYAQGEWWVMSTDTPNLGRSVDSTPGARGLFIGGLNNAPSPNTLRTEIDYINLASTGDAVDFGDITAGRLGGACSSKTRAIKMGGLESPGIVQDIDFVTIASTGDATTFGNLGTGVRSTSSVANATRGIVGGGVPTTSTMQYVQLHQQAIVRLLDLYLVPDPKQWEQHHRQEDFLLVEKLQVESILLIL